MTARYEYDVFGAARSEAGAIGNTHKFTGKEYDADVKPRYYGPRHYNPHAGKFILRA